MPIVGSISTGSASDGANFNSHMPSSATSMRKSIAGDIGADDKHVGWRRIYLAGAPPHASTLSLGGLGALAEAQQRASAARAGHREREGRSRRPPALMSMVGGGSPAPRACRHAGGPR